MHSPCLIIAHLCSWLSLTIAVVRPTSAALDVARGLRTTSPPRQRPALSRPAIGANCRPARLRL
eukprot:6608200-Pyramimonas_sp.AAC.1